MEKFRIDKYIMDQHGREEFRVMLRAGWFRWEAVAVHDTLEKAFADVAVMASYPHRVDRIRYDHRGHFISEGF